MVTFKEIDDGGTLVILIGLPTFDIAHNLQKLIELNGATAI